MDGYNLQVDDLAYFDEFIDPGMHFALDSGCLID